MTTPAQPGAGAPGPIRILGIDPGSVYTGFGLIETDGINNRHLHHGRLALGNGAMPERLGAIFRGLDALVREWQPAEIAIEQVFVARNALAALKLGQARGAALSAVVQHDLPVAEYSPRAIKQATAGTGSATKEQMQHMVKVLLNLPEVPVADAADALAVALCHGHQRRVAQALGGTTGTRYGRRRRRR